MQIRTFKVASLRSEDLRGLQSRQQQVQQHRQQEGPSRQQQGQQEQQQGQGQQEQRQQQVESEPASPPAASEAVAAQPLRDGASGAVAYLQAQASRELEGGAAGSESGGMAFTLILMEYADR